MTDEQAVELLLDALKRQRESGVQFGRIEVVQRGGEVKHVNESFEVLPAKGGRYSPIKGQSPDDGQGCRGWQGLMGQSPSTHA